MTKTIDIGLVRYPGAQASAILGLADLLAIGGNIASKRPQDLPKLRITEWTCDPGLAPVTPGVGQDVLLLPPALGLPIEVGATGRVAAALRSAHGKGSILASVCAGAFLLAETGLLDGRRATTHWAYADEFAARFPRVMLDPDRLIVDEGDIVTAGGLMSWTDLGLKLIDRFLGPSVMVETAQILLLDPPGREQRFYSSITPRLNHGDAAILRVQHWMQANGGKETALAVLAARAGLEQRTFLRRFLKATGLTSTDYAQRLRVNRARELLQFSQQPVETIAWEVGYRDPAAFRKVFHRVVGLTPGEFRQRFHA